MSRRFLSADASDGAREDGPGSTLAVLGRVVVMHEAHKSATSQTVAPIVRLESKDMDPILKGDAAPFGKLTP